MENLFPILLQASIAIPLLLAIVLFLLGARAGISGSRWIAGIGFGLPFLLSLLLFVAFNCGVAENGGEGGFAFLSSIDTGLSMVGIQLTLGLNGISAPLYLLAGIIGLAAGIYAMYSAAERLHLYLALLLLMHAGLMGVFASVDIFFFYFFHELALIPTFIMIGIWGGHGRRVAAIEMTIYLTLGAMLSLLGLVALYSASGFDSFDLIHLRAYLQSVPFSEAIQSNIYALLLFGFGILVSLFPFHSWAPRGYAAAPSSVAMLHAGVLKKFGLYGLIQIGLPLLPAGVLEWNPVLLWLALGNIIIIGLVTMAQRDLKLLIGNSSVMHMGYCFLGIVAFSTTGVGGALILMFGHGLSVALMFLLATSIYRRTQTWDLFEMGGVGPKAPVLAGFFVAATMASIGLPGFANFWGELTVFVGLWQLHPWAVVPAVLGVVISAVYGLRAAARIFFGPPTAVFARSAAYPKITDLSASERLPAGMLLAALLIVGLWPSSITHSLNADLEVNRPLPILEQSGISAATETATADTHS